VAGVLGYKVKENVTLQAGYRYLSVNYHAGGARSFLFDAALSGVAFGFTINLK
jgi:opacity protein-like surface antigen